MAAVSGRRRGRGEDSIDRDATWSCYVGAVSLGYGLPGTRVRKRVMARTRTEVREKLEELRQPAENGVRPRRHDTVNGALDGWLEAGLDELAPSAVTVSRTTIAKALREGLGPVELTKLTAGAVRKALANLAAQVSARTVLMAHDVLVRVIRHAGRDDLAGRNVAALVKPPKGQLGERPSKSLTVEQAVSLMAAARGTRLSRRALALPRRCVEALREHRVRQAQDRLAAGPSWQDHGLVFASAAGTAMDDHNVRPMFRAITEDAGLGTGWVPREMRHTFVSLLSARGVPVEAISLLAGHNQTATTELVYRHQIVPALTRGAEVMDQIFD